MTTEGDDWVWTVAASTFDGWASIPMSSGLVKSLESKDIFGKISHCEMIVNLT